MLSEKTFFLFSFLFISFHINANEPADTIYVKKKNKALEKEKIFNAPLVLKTSPTAFLYGGFFPYTAEYRFMVEITSSRTQSDQLSVSYLGKSLLLKSLEQAIKLPASDVYKVNGWRLQYAHKFYLIRKQKHAPYGFYFGPHVSYSNVHISLGLNRYYHQTYYDFRLFNANLIFGLQTGKMKRITMDLYGGIGYKSNKAYYHSSTYNVFQLNKDPNDVLFNTNLNLLFGVNLGYSF